MEERGPPAHDYDDHSTPLPNVDDPSSLPLEDHQHRPFRPGTYVIQVPRDQIYRVPPPEHAAFVESQQKLQPGGKRSCCSCLCLVSTIVATLLTLAVIGTLCIVLIKKDNPNILVARVLIKNGNHPEYDITLGSENPNQHTSIFSDQNGEAFLSFDSKEIATGKYPVFDQGPRSSTSIQIALNGSNAMLPKEKGNIDLLLQVIFPVKMKIGPVVIKGNVVTVLCNFKVDTLASNHTHVLSQDCEPVK